MSLSVPDAVAAYTAGVDALLAADVDTASHHDLLTAFADLETASRRVPTTGYAILARLAREADPKTLGATSLWKLIALRTRISKGDAQRRIRRATLLTPHTTLQGELLPAEWEHTAAALTQGCIGEDHVEVIGKFFKALPATIDAITRAQAEQTLADVATRLDPKGLTTAAIHLLALLHPDGEEPAEQAARKVGLTLGKQQPDGTSYLSGWISAKMRALLEPLQAKFAERDRHQTTTGQGSEPTDDPDQLTLDPDPDPDSVADEPQAPPAEDRTAFDAHVDDPPLPPAESPADDPSAPPVEDPTAFDEHPDDPPPPPVEPVLDTRWRTKSQYTHDAVEQGLELLLSSGTLGTLNGLPTTVVVTTTLQDLHTGAGYAVTGGGSRLPMRDLIAMAAHAYHYLAVFDGHTQQAIHLGRAQRCATGAQKLMLFARDRGCTAPGCAVPFYQSQAHHAVADWKHHGQTNVDTMTLACPPDNRLIEETPWTTHRRPDGRIAWTCPTQPDWDQPHVNDIHHPERLLAPRDDDPL